MLSESGSLFYRPKQKKLEGMSGFSPLELKISTNFVLLADTARQNFVKPGGDHFTLLNVWEQWQDSGFSISWTYEHFIQIKVCLRLSRLVTHKQSPNDEFDSLLPASVIFEIS